MLKSFWVGAALLALSALPAMACETISSAVVKFTACVETGKWNVQPSAGVQEFIYYSGDESVALIVITEKEAFSLADFRNAVLANATAAADKPEDVVILAERNETIGGKAWNVLEYSVVTDGTKLQFQNYYLTERSYGSVQIVVYSLPEDATTAAYRAGEFLSTAKLH